MDLSTRFEYELYEAVIGKLSSILEHVGNRYLEEGYVPENYETLLAQMNAREGIEWFLRESGVYASNNREVYKLIRDKELLILDFQLVFFLNFSFQLCLKRGQLGYSGMILQKDICIKKAWILGNWVIFGERMISLKIINAKVEYFDAVDKRRRS